MEDKKAPVDSRKVLLDVQGVTKVYSKRSLLGRGPAKVETRALDTINFSLREGETLGLLGPNGSGKTTLLKIISTLIEPTAGSVRLDNIDIASKPTEARGKIGLVTCDERSFYWRLSGRENLEFFGALYGLPAERTRERSAMLFELLGLAHAADRPFQSYSSGMKQKLAIARGLLAEPRLILYDEPTRSLDPLSASQIRRWLKENRKAAPQQTHLIATNQLQEAAELCDRVLIINRGVLIASGSVAEIRGRWNAEAHARYYVSYTGVVSSDMLSQLTGSSIPEFEVDGSAGTTTISFEARNGDGRLSAVLAAILSAGGSVSHCRSEQASFEEIFCAMVEAPQAKEQSQ